MHIEEEIISRYLWMKRSSSPLEIWKLHLLEIINSLRENKEEASLPTVVIHTLLPPRKKIEKF